MVDSHEGMGLGRDQTQDPGFAVRHVSAERHVIDCVMRPWSNAHEETRYFLLPRTHSREVPCMSKSMHCRATTLAPITTF